MVPSRGFAPRSADYRSAALLLSYAGKWRTTGAWECAGETAEGSPSGRYSRERERQHGGHAPQTVSGPIRFQGGPGALVRFIFQSWLPQMGSHHHSRIQNPESCLLDDTAKNIPGRNCTCGLKVRNLAFCLLNYGDENGATARTCTRLPPIPRARIAFYASAANAACR